MCSGFNIQKHLGVAGGCFGIGFLVCARVWFNTKRPLSVAGGLWNFSGFRGFFKSLVGRGWVGSDLHGAEEKNISSYYIIYIRFPEGLCAASQHATKSP